MIAGIKRSIKNLFVACVGCKLSQNTYSDAFAHVPMDFRLHVKPTSTKPDAQQPFLASKNPEKVK